MRQVTQRDHQSDRAAARDRGLRRAARAKGWLAVLAVGLTVALSAVAAEALPGASRRHVAAAVRPASTLSSASGPMAPDPTADDPAPTPESAGTDVAPEETGSGSGDSSASGDGSSSTDSGGSGDSGSSASDPAASAPLQPPPEPPAAAPSDQSSGAVSGGS